MNILKVHKDTDPEPELSLSGVLLTVIGVLGEGRSHIRDTPSQTSAAAGGQGQTNKLPSTHLNPLLVLGGARCSHHNQHHTRQALSGGHSAERNGTLTCRLIWVGWSVGGCTRGFCSRWVSPTGLASPAQDVQNLPNYDIDLREGRVCPDPELISAKLFLKVKSRVRQLAIRRGFWFSFFRLATEVDQHQIKVDKNSSRCNVHPNKYMQKNNLNLWADTDWMVY